MIDCYKKKPVSFSDFHKKKVLAYDLGLDNKG